MNGLIALLGSGEYLEVVDPIDEYLLQSLNLNGRKACVVCLPTAAGREGEGSINRWSRMGIDHFERLGAKPVALPIVDQASANDARYEAQLESADIIYFSGGDPVYLYQTLDGSRAWVAARKAWERGAIYAGCSAGAMILARNMPNLRMAGTNIVSGFGVVPACYIFPHYDAMPVIFKPMIMVLRRGLKSGEYILGIEENTALVGKREGEWRVIGAGKVHVIFNGRETAFEDGETVVLQPPA